MKYLFLIVLLVFGSCTTIPVEEVPVQLLPMAPVPDLPDLVIGSENRIIHENYLMFFLHHVDWQRWASDVLYSFGAIDEKEYNLRNEVIDDLLDTIESSYNELLELID